jgi:hypothetical protein
MNNEEEKYSYIWDPEVEIIWAKNSKGKLLKILYRRNSQDTKYQGVTHFGFGVYTVICGTGTVTCGVSTAFFSNILQTPFINH